MIKIVNSIIIILICFENILFANTVCDDWQAFKDEKCFKIFGSVQSYDEAVNACRQYNSTIVTIHSIEEQHFIENYLFTTLKIVENVWTGLKYSDTKYKWLNEFEAEFTNWSENSPKNNTELCVQISSDELSLGKWSDISCTKSNLALCKKTPKLTLQLLMNLLVDTRRKLENTSNYFDYFFSDKWINFKTFLENNARKALIYPYKSQAKVQTRSDAIKLCKQNNATLVDIESEEKQKLVQSFLYEININIEYGHFFIGGFYDASAGKYKWENSGNEFNYTNWASDNNAANLPYVVITNYENANKGKWYKSDATTPYNVFCEIRF